MNSSRKTARIAGLLYLILIITGNLTYAQQKDDKQLATNFDKILSEQFKANEPGVTALVSRNGQIIYKKAFGIKIGVWPAILAILNTI